MATIFENNILHYLQNKAKIQVYIVEKSKLRQINIYIMLYIT